MATIDLLVVAAYFAAVVALGCFAGKGQSSGLAYFLADRSVTWLPAGIAMTAVSISSITFIGMPGQAFKSDWTFLQIYIMVPFASLLVCKFFLPVYSLLNVLTAYEYLERRFDLRIRLIAGALFLLIICGATGVALYAPAIMLSEMTGFSVANAVLIVGAITTIYTMLGGIRGVIYTDILQAFVFMAGWLLTVVFILKALPGGAAQAWTEALAHDKLRILNFSPDPRVPATIWSGLIAMLFTHVALGGISQTQVQKFLTVSSMRGGRRAILFHGFSQLGVYVAFFALGTLLFVFYRIHTGHLPAGIASDRVFPFFIMREMPPGVRGFLLAGAFAPAMSTVSSALNSLANVAVVDFLDRLRPGDTVRRAKIFTAVWGVVVMGAGLLAWRLGSILELIVKVNSYFYGCLLGIFLLGIWTTRACARGATIGLAAGVLAVLLCSAFQPDLWIWFGAIGCLVCFSTGYISSVHGEAAPRAMIGTDQIR
jgi:SSS family solute:Na+ symporter